MMKVGLLNYDILCDDRPLTKDELHRILAYKLNPLLARINNKYSVTDDHVYKKRKLVEWINEIEGARILIIRDYNNIRFENMIVNWLYSLRDFLVEHKIDFNTFKRYVAEIAAIAAHKNQELYTDVLSILNVIGCSLSLEITSSSIEDEVLKNNIMKILRNLSYLLNENKDETVRLIVKVIKRKKPEQNVPIRVIYSYSLSESERNAIPLDTVTDAEGKAIIPVKKFSIIRIKVRNKEKTLLIGNKDAEVVFNFKYHFNLLRGKTLLIIVASAVAALIAVLFFFNK